MKNTELIVLREEYHSPTMRLISTEMEVSFLLSNLEPIGGGDNPDIDW